MIPFARFQLTALEKLLLISLLVLTIVRCVLAAVTELTPDEALLQEWARHPSATGFEGGAAAMWIAKTGSALIGHSALGPRLFAPWLAAIASWGIYRLARSIGGEKPAAWAVTLVNLTPWFNLGAVQLRPSTLAAYCGLGTMIAMWRALRRAGRWDVHWIAAGFLMALGLWCDWSAVWLPVGAICTLALTRHWQGRLRSPGPWCMVLVFVLLGPLPFALLGNSDGGGLAAGWSARWDQSALSFQQPISLIAKWLAAVSPFLLVGIFWAARQHWSEPVSDTRAGAQLLVSFCFPSLFVALLVSFVSAGQPGLLSCAVLPGVTLLAVYWEHLRLRAQLKNFLMWTGVFVAMAMSIMTVHSDALRGMGIPLSYRRDPARDSYGWKSMAEEVAAIFREASPDAPDGAFLIAEDAELASALNFYLPRDLHAFQAGESYPQVQVIESATPTNAYYYWPRYDEESGQGTGPYFGHTALYISRSASDSPPEGIRRAFAEVSPLQIFEVTRRGQVLFRVKVFACFDYGGLPL